MQFKTKVMLILCLWCFSSSTLKPETPEFQVQVLFSFGTNGTKPGQLHHPLAISIDPNGNIYVADTGNYRIQKFDSKGQLITFIGGFGWESEQFQQPVDIWAEDGLNVYVADYENRRVEHYDKDLHWIRSFYSLATQPDRLQFGFVCGVSVSIHGECFLVDDENNRILKLNTQWQPELSFGDFNWGEGRLDRPGKVVVSKEDKVYVSDLAARRIVMFDYYGNYLAHWGEEVLLQPKGLCLTSSGHLLVCDWAAHRVVVFDQHGRMINSWGSQGNKLGAFNHPADVAAFEDKVYVVDSENHRIQVFMLKPKT